MCVLFVSFGSKIKPRTFGCIAKRLFCLIQAKPVCRYGCMYFMDALVLVYVDVIMMSST